MIPHLKLLVPAPTALSAVEVDWAATSTRALALSEKTNNFYRPPMPFMQPVLAVASKANSRSISNGCTITYHLMKTGHQRHLARSGDLTHSVRQVRPVRRPSLPILVFQPVSTPRTVLRARIIVWIELFPWLRTFTLQRFPQKILKNPNTCCLVSKINISSQRYQGMGRC